MAILTFEVDTTFFASLSVPASSKEFNTREYRLHRTEAGRYRIMKPTEARIQSARLEKWVRPSFSQSILASNEKMQGGRVRIQAKIEAVPNIKQS